MRPTTRFLTASVALFAAILAAQSVSQDWPGWRGGSFQIPGVREPSWSHPVILGGCLYLREQDALYSYDIHAGQ